MTAFALPARLAACLQQDPLPARRAWAAELAGTARELAGRWALTWVGAPFQPGGSGAWVAPASDAAGNEVVLKVGWRHEEGEHEADGLRAWAGPGAVLLREAWAGGQTSALLLERCRPGTALAAAVVEQDQDAVIAGLLSRLWATPAPLPFSRPLMEGSRSPGPA